MLISDRGAEGHGRKSVSGQTIPNRRRHCAYHEDAQNTLAQLAHLRTLQPIEVPCQGIFKFIIIHY